MAEKRYQPFTSKYIILLLVIVCIISVFWGIFLSADYAIFRKKAEPVDAYVNDVQVHYRSRNRKTYDAYLSYSVNGESYEYVIYKYRSSRRYKLKSEYIGRKVSMLYDPDKPWVARPAEPPYRKSLLMVIAGIASAGLSFWFHRKNVFYQKLFASGAILDAVVTDIKHEVVVHRSGAGRRGLVNAALNSPESIDKEHYSTIICEWDNPVTGEKYTFKSVRVKEFVEPYVGQTIRVYADPQNYSRYFVDVDDLLAKPFVGGSSKPFTYGKNP